MTVHFTAIPAIKVAETRQRKAFDAAKLFDLTEDIRSTGLIQPIVLSGTDLLAGERRLRAVTELAEMGVAISFMGAPVPLGTIPALQLSEVDEVTRMQVEFSENEYRDALTWQERAKAQAALLALRQAQDRAVGAVPRTVAEVAKEALGKPVITADQLSTVRTNINVAKYLDDPEVAKATTAKEAAKIIKRREQTANNLLAAQEFKTTAAKSDLTSLHRIYHASCTDLTLDMIGEPIDLILSDPPYGIGAHTFGDGSSNVKGQHQYDDSLASWRKLMPEFLALTSIVAAPQSAMYLFCDFDRFHELKEMCQVAGWYVHRTPIIWSKMKNGLVPIPGESYARSYETILYASRGKLQLQRTGPDVITASPDENLGHGAQKPVALFMNLIQRTVPAGSLVADFFAGSGPIVPAAHAAHCRSIAVERDEAHYGIICNRLKELQNDSDPFADLG
jgi:DNA modification methylase